jgi:hypothetical protein
MHWIIRRGGPPGNAPIARNAETAGPGGLEPSSFQVAPVRRPRYT